MTITSTDIQEQSFSLDKRGYDVDEVDMFLEQVADGIDVLNDRIAQLQAQLAEAQRQNADSFNDIDREEIEALSMEKDKRIADLERQLESRKAESNAVAQALIIAQRSADELTANASAKANAITQEAEKEARRIIARAEEDKKNVIETTKKLEIGRERARQDYKDFLAEFINDASARLAEIGETNPNLLNASVASSLFPRKSASGDYPDVTRAYQPPRQSFIAAQSVVAPSTPVAPAAPTPAPVEKDFSGFGAVDDNFSFDEID